MRAAQGICVYFLATSSGLLCVLLSQGALGVLDGAKWSIAADQQQQKWLRLMRIIASSDVSMFLALNWVFAATSMFVLLTTVLFLGQLSGRESALLVDRLIKYCAFKLMFVSAIRLPPTLQETAEWITWFAVAGFMRIFIGMGRDRLEALMAAPAAPFSAHVRALALVLLILVRNCMAIRDLWVSAGSTTVAAVLGMAGFSEMALAAFHTAGHQAQADQQHPQAGAQAQGQVQEAAAAQQTGHSKRVDGPTARAYMSSGLAGGGGISRVVLCAYDLAIIQIEAVKTLVKYGVYVAEQLATRRALLQAAAPHGHPSADAFAVPAAGAGGYGGMAGMAEGSFGAWEGKGVLLYHVELVADVLMHVMTIVHYLHMWCLHGFALHVVDIVLLMDVRQVAASLYRRIKQFSEYRVATYRLHHAFPDARLAEDEPCSICMETMQVAKQLPCGHHFHLACLRAWLQQSGAHTFNCPNCRQPLLVNPSLPARPPTLLDRARQHVNRRLTLCLLRVVQWLLDADRAIMQWSLRAQLRYQQQHGRRGAGGIRSHPLRRRVGLNQAHEEPEGSGESSHPAPVSRMAKLARRLRSFIGLRGPAHHAVAVGHGGQLHGGWWHRILGRHRAAAHAEQHRHMGGHGAWVPGHLVEPVGGALSEEEIGTDMETTEAGRDSSDGWDQDGSFEQGASGSDSQGVSEEGDQEGWAGAGAGIGSGYQPQGGPSLQEWDLTSQGAVVSGDHGHTPAGRSRWQYGTHQQQRSRLGDGGGPSGSGLPPIHPNTRRQLRQQEEPVSQQRRRFLRPAVPTSSEVPTWSAGVLQQVAHQVARSVRSSLAHGDSRAAVAGRGPADEEVCSRPAAAGAASGPAAAHGVRRRHH